MLGRISIAYMRIPPDLALTLAAVVSEGGFEPAAAALGITQPAVSQRLRTLESLLGQVLLVRSRPVRPTQAGEAVIRYARQLSHLEADAMSAIGIREEGSLTSLPIAVNSDSLSTWFLPAIAELSARLPVVFDLHRDDQDFTVRLLEEGTVIAAVTSRAEPIAGCRVTPLGAMRYVPFATIAFHDRWFPEGVTTAALERAPLVDYDRRDDLQTRWLIRQGVDPALPPRQRVPASADFADAVLMGMGWGQLLPFQSDEPHASGRIRSLSPVGIDVPLYWQQWHLRSALLDEVGDAVVRRARAVLIPVHSARIARIPGE